MMGQIQVIFKSEEANFVCSLDGESYVMYQDFEAVAFKSGSYS